MQPLLRLVLNRAWLALTRPQARGVHTGSQGPASSRGSFLPAPLPTDRVKPAAAIFSRALSINAGSRLQAAEMDETTAGASEGEPGGGRATAC